MDGRLLEFFRTRPDAPGRRYRTNPREESIAAAELLWEPGARGPAAPTARLLDVGRLGAALLTDTPPPLAANVRLRLVAPARTPWIEAKVLAVEPAGASAHRVRLRFGSPCPSAFLAPAVLGLIGESDEPPRGDAS